MTNNHNHEALRLSLIPTNTVVHTPTEAEAKELLSILHENGYQSNASYESIIAANRRIYSDPSVISFNISYNINIGHCYRSYYEKLGYTILTLAEFKERYCEGEKPQPKFEVGDKVLYNGKIKIVNEIDQTDIGFMYNLSLPNGQSPLYLHESKIVPYAEPKTKPTEENSSLMEVNKDAEPVKSDANKGLNLCELLKGRCTTFYSPMWGDTDVLQLYDVNLRIAPCKDHATWLNTDEQGKCDDDGICMLWPSRALYEQYPLDPYTAWMKWQEEQTIFHIRIEFQPYEERGEMKCGNMGTLHFDDLKLHTPADRDKCIEEIKAIIEKYSK